MNPKPISWLQSISWLSTSVTCVGLSFLKYFSWTSLGLWHAAQIGRCAFQGAHFPRFKLEGKPPRRVFRRGDELTLCRAYRKHTCCAPEQTNAALVSIKKLAIYGEGSADCVSNWEAVECSICDPQVGVFLGPPLICSSLCHALYESCSDAYFANDPTTQVTWVLLCTQVLSIVTSQNKVPPDCGSGN